MFYFPFHSPTNEYYDVDSISEYFSVCPRTHVCVCVYLTRHSKFCSPSLEHCLFFQDLPSSADGHSMIVLCVCFIQNQIRYRCYKRKSVGSHPVHL